jgi:hypothetical protein
LVRSITSALQLLNVCRIYIMIYHTRIEEMIYCRSVLEHR